MESAESKQKMSFSKVMTRAIHDVFGMEIGKVRYAVVAGIEYFCIADVSNVLNTDVSLASKLPEPPVKVDRTKYLYTNWGNIRAAIGKVKEKTERMKLMESRKAHIDIPSKFELAYHFKKSDAIADFYNKICSMDDSDMSKVISELARYIDSLEQNFCIKHLNIKLSPSDIGKISLFYFACLASEVLSERHRKEPTQKPDQNDNVQEKARETASCGKKNPEVVINKSPDGSVKIEINVN